MHYAIIADIHANLAAFTAVLEDIGQQAGVEEYNGNNLCKVVRLVI